MELKQIIRDRRSYYSLSPKSPITNDAIKSLIDTAILNVPSAFNSQSARMILLLNEHHVRLWDIVKDTLQAILPAEAFNDSKGKIDNCFRSGYGTVLFFEDQRVVKGLQEQFPLYQDNFPVWSQHSSAMHQYAVWLLLEEAGFGATLQHYNPLINSAVAQEWKIDSEWKLVAQMPFGVPAQQPDQKVFSPLDNRRLFFE
ncbi:MAG: nitroreductase family protein [Tannerella sp.]|jgi:predicted oxidoreductase (fatty acid repression mutant protein)|nr:nitroreductase family protein [Tannerella sp.]